MRSIKDDMYDEAFRLWDMVPAGTVPGYGSAGSVYRFANGCGHGEYWAYFHDNLFAVNAFDMTFEHAGVMRYRHAEHLSIGYYEAADLIVQSGGSTLRAGAISTYLAEEGAEYVALYQPGSATRATSITISPDYYRDYLQARFGNIPDVRRAFALVDGRTDFPELVALFKQVRAYQGTGMAATLFYEGAVAEALALVIERAAAIEAERAEGSAPSLSKEDRAALDDLSAHINGNLAGALSCEELARRACMGQTKLKAAFKAAYGTSPAAFVADARIERAIELLNSTDEPIAHIARAVGYRKPGAFAEAFRRRTGVRIEVLARRTSGALVYVYRPRLLTRAIQQEQVAAFLTAEGYDPSSLSACIEKLHKRICGTDLQSQMTGRCSFPHEIGFFLGYPYEDVIGFIDNEGENFLCSGCWKVYAKERDAQTCFCCYKNCTTMYQQLFDEGVSIECLAAVDEDFPAAEAFRAAG